MVGEIDAGRLRKVVRELEEESGRPAGGKRRSKAKKKATKRRRCHECEDRADTPPVLPPIREGRWTPPGIAFEMLARPLQAALVELVGPLYEELVLAAPDALERSTGLTLTHLLWLEILEQYELGCDYSVVSGVLGTASPDRGPMIDQHLRLLEAKLRASHFLVQARECARRCRRGPRAIGFDGPGEAPRQLAHAPAEGIILENLKNGDQKTSAAHAAAADVQ
jgi:hypothetical protein